MSISAKTVKELRESTGAGMMDCKKALVDADGDMEKAAELLRERGAAKAQKREGRDTSEGTIAFSSEGKSGGIVELTCETDFVARTDDFVQLAEKLAAAVSADAGIDSVESLLQSKIDGETVEEVVKAGIAKMGENILVQRVARLELPSEGVVGGYVHAGGNLGVLVGVLNGSAEVAKDIAMHIAAVDPSPVAIDRESVDAAIVEKERDFFRKQAEQSGKPEQVIDKIVEGQVNKFYSQICLLEQGYVKDPDRSVKDRLSEDGENSTVSGYIRFKLGEASES